MRYKHLIVLVFVIVVFSMLFAACGDEEGDTTVEEEVTTDVETGTTDTSTDGEATETTPVSCCLDGTWSIVTEDGRTPAEWGYNSITLTLTEDTFTSEYDSGAGTCTWSGTYTSTPTTMAWTADSATGPPCDQAVGQTRETQVSLSADGNTLTLDWTAEAMLTLQVYERTS